MLIYVISMEFLPLRRRYSSTQNVPSGKERGETAVFAGYLVVEFALLLESYTMALRESCNEIMVVHVGHRKLTTVHCVFKCLVIVNFDIPQWPWDERLLSAKANAGNYLVQTQQNQ